METRPIASSPAVSRRMAVHPRRDTGPEMAVRRLLHSTGFRYRVCWKVPGTPRRTIDIAFTRAKVAVFIDGCFWHGCPEHGQTPTSNRRWWADKISRNQERDSDTTRKLENAGWTVLRIWEHVPPDEATELIRTVLARRQTPEPSREVLPTSENNDRCSSGCRDIKKCPHP
jgi:DNA mismatch endonuclease, patch repair protein